MLDRPELEPLFFAPFVSSAMAVLPEWIDDNDHLNLAYYHTLFDNAVEELFTLIGVNSDYKSNRKLTMFAAEAHVRYLRELNVGDPVRVTIQRIGHDHKRLLLFKQLFHAQEGWISATSETMSLHVDLTTRKTANFPADIGQRLASLQKSHMRLPQPEAAGRHIAMPVRS